MVDVCSLGAGLAVAPGLADPQLRLSRGPVLAGFGLGAAVPALLFTVLHEEPEPPTIGGPAPEIIGARQFDDEALIVEFMDFECPFCRQQHRRLAEILSDYGEEVKVVYKHVPLRMHPHAREAARYACCADEQGRGKAMVDALFSRDRLTETTSQECAEQLGLDPTALQECLASERPDARLKEDGAAAKKAGVRSLPTCYVGDQRFVGLQGRAEAASGDRRRAGGPPRDAVVAGPIHTGPSSAALGRTRKGRRPRAPSSRRSQSQRVSR